MKIISKIIMVLLFVIFFGFALNNTEEVKLRFFFGYEFPGPLVLMLLLFFIAGIILGVFAMLPTLFRHRRDVSRYKKMLVSAEQRLVDMKNGDTLSPVPDGISNE